MRPPPFLASLLLAAALPACGPGYRTLSALPWSDASQWADAPAGSVSWEWILDTARLPEPPPAVDYFGVEGLDVDGAYVANYAAGGTASDGGPRQPWCYLSAGTAEDWRDDYDAFLDRDEADRAAGNEGLVGDVYPEWPDERWLNVRRYPEFFDLIEARLDVCAGKGFVLVELDNMDGFETETGFDLSEDDELAYVRAVQAAAADRGLGVLHKNAGSLAPDLADEFDAMLLEDCTLGDFCEESGPYLDAGKPAFSAEYPERWFEEARAFDLEGVCEEAESAGVSTLVKKLDLTEETIVCAALLAGD
jgi:endo-alpha-1,4-polygalactosaminidase (GH114 family)